MLRVEYGRYGGPEELHLVDVPPGPLGKDQIQVRVKAASVNPVDWKIRAGMLKIMTGRKFPRGMGEDYAGVVEAVGAEVTRFKVGDQGVRRDAPEGSRFLRRGDRHAGADRDP